MGLLLAHGVGARGDLPVDPSFLAWGGGLVLLVSFAAFGVLWTRPWFGVGVPTGHDRRTAGEVDLATVAVFDLPRERKLASVVGCWSPGHTIVTAARADRLAVAGLEIEAVQGP